MAGEPSRDKARGRERVRGSGVYPAWRRPAPSPREKRISGAMSIGLIVTLMLLVAAMWVLVKMVRSQGTRIRVQPHRRLVERVGDTPGLTPADRRRLYRQLGLDPATLRHAPGRGTLRLRLADLRRSDRD